MNNESLKIANDNLYCANKLLKNKINELNKTIAELREFVINWDIDYYGLTSDEDKQRLQELKDILEIKEDNEIEKITMRAGLVGSIDNKLENLDINIMAVEDKINEIIDHINGSDKE